MATRTSNGTGGGMWSAGASWAGGVAPGDDDTVIIAAGDTITVDFDGSGWTNGVNGLTITGHATTPGMLAFRSDVAGVYWLKIKAGTNVQGSGATTLYGRLMMGGGTWGSPAAPDHDRKHVLEFAGTGAGKLTGLYLAGQCLCNEPTNAYVEVYKTAYGPVAQAAAVTPADDYIDWGTAPPAAGTAVKVRSTGTLPGGLTEIDLYYVRSVSGTKCKLALQSDDATIVNITSVGSGSITLYDGHTDTGTKTLNVLQDVRSDTPWTTIAGYNRVTLCDIGPADTDTQIDTLATINAGSVVLTGANVDSAQYPLARLYLCSRNVQILSNTTSASQPIVDLTGWTGSVGNAWNLSCAIVAIASTTASRYGYCISGGTGTIGVATVTATAGILAYAARGLSSGNFYNFKTIVGCGYGIMYGAGCTITTIAGCSTACYSNTGAAITIVLGCATAISSNLGCTVATIAGCNYGIYLCTGCNVTTIAGCSYAVYAGTGCMVGTIAGCNYGIARSAQELLGTAFVGNARDIFLSSGTVYGWGSSLNAAVQVGDYKYSTTRHAYPGICQILDIGGVAGAIGAWTPGGTIKTAAGQHVLTAEDSGADVWVAIPIRAVVGQAVSITVTAQLSGIAAWTDRPTFALRDPGQPWKGVSEILASSTQANDTNAQSHTLNYVPTYNRELEFLVRAKGGNAGGTGTETCTFTFTIQPATMPVAMAAVG